MRSFLALAVTALSAGGAFAASLHTVFIQSSGTFTIPANVKAATQFEFTLVGGGGGAKGCGDNTSSSSGGSGGAGSASFSGFNPSDTITVAIGAGGAGGAHGNDLHNGSPGGATSLTYGGTVIAQATGGTASAGSGVNPGLAGTFSAAAGATSLTLEASMALAAQDGAALVGIPNTTGGIEIAGGNNSIGLAGTSTHRAGMLGGGGHGCAGTDDAGGAGGTGVVIVRWVR